MKLERTIDLPRMIAYAGATWDWHRLHYDVAYVKRLNAKAPVVDGQMFGALLAAMIGEHFGPRAFIARMSLTYKAMVYAGETVICTGEQGARDGDDVEVELTVTAGDRVAVLGSATVRTPEED